jgi:hypothetical protein
MRSEEQTREAHEAFAPLGCHNAPDEDGALRHYHDAGAISTGVLEVEGREVAVYLRLGDAGSPVGLVIQLGPSDAEEVGRSLIAKAEHLRKSRSN